MKARLFPCLRPQAPSGQSGFTLTELMIVVAIVGVMAAFALPSFNDLMRGQRVKNASFNLMAALTLARSEAVKRNGDVTITPAGGDWSAGWTISSGLGSQAAMDGLVFVNGSGCEVPASVTYNKSGRVSAGAGDPPICFQMDTSASATKNVRCLTIDLSGLPRTKNAVCTS